MQPRLRAGLGKRSIQSWLVGTGLDRSAHARVAHEIGWALRDANGLPSWAALQRAIFGDVPDLKNRLGAFRTWFAGQKDRGLGRFTPCRDERDAQRILAYVEHTQFIDGPTGSERASQLRDAWARQDAHNRAIVEDATRLRHRTVRAEEQRIGTKDRSALTNTDRELARCLVPLNVATSWPPPRVADLKLTEWPFQFGFAEHAELPTPYVRRTSDDLLDRAVRTALDTHHVTAFGELPDTRELDADCDDWTKRVVVVAGPPAAGKSRAIIEALKRHRLDQCRILAVRLPTDSERFLARLSQRSLANATGLGTRVRPVIVLVDDLHHHLRRGEAFWHAAELITAPAPQSVILVASTHDDVLNMDRQSAQLAGYDLAELARIRAVAIPYSASLDKSEQLRAAELYAGQLEEGSIDLRELERLPEKLASVPQLRQRSEYALKSATADPLRASALRAVLDATILRPDGFDRGLWDELATRWHATHAPTRVLPTAAQLDGSFNSLTQPLNYSQAVVQPADRSNGTWHLHDVLAQILRRSHLPEPTHHERCSGYEYFLLGEHCQREDVRETLGDWVLEHAAHWFRLGDTLCEWRASLRLAEWLGESGERESAFDTLLRTSEHDDWFVSFLVRESMIWLKSLAERNAEHGLAQRCQDQIDRLPDRYVGGRQLTPVEGYALPTNAKQIGVLSTLFAAQREREKGDLDSMRGWYERATAAGIAMLRLGAKYEADGDLDEARRQYSISEQLGNLDAQKSYERLAIPDELHLWGLSALGGGDLVKAREWFERAAIAGHVDAMVDLGYVIERAGDVAEAGHWYRRAAEAGNVTGMRNCGVLALDAGDLVKAREWFERAAIAGHVDAMVDLGHVIEQAGELGTAGSWYWQAACAGNRGAIDDIARIVPAIADQMDHAQLRALVASIERERDASAFSRVLPEMLAAETHDDFAAAVNRLKEAAALGDADAWEWFERAATAGHVDAMIDLGNLIEQTGDLATTGIWYSLAASGDRTALTDDIATGSIEELRNIAADLERSRSAFLRVVVGMLDAETSEQFAAAVDRLKAAAAFGDHDARTLDALRDAIGEGEMEG